MTLAPAVGSSHSPGRAGPCSSSTTTRSGATDADCNHTPAPRLPPEMRSGSRLPIGTNRGERDERGSLAGTGLRHRDTLHDHVPPKRSTVGHKLLAIVLSNH